MYKSLDVFIFRTPHYSLSSLSDFEKKKHNPIFREMLEIAIPNLNLEKIKEYIDKEEYLTYLFFQRACTRSTPFGLFAGYSIGTIAERTQIQLLKQKEYKRITQLGVNSIYVLVKQIEKNWNIRKLLCYYPNRSIQRVGNYFRYIEYCFQETNRVCQLSQIAYSKYLQKLLLLARNGMSFSELVTRLIDNEITEDEAEGFIHELIDAQILMSDLEPELTDIQPLKTLIKKLNKLAISDRCIINILSEIENQLEHINKQPIGETGGIYSEIVKNLKLKNGITYSLQTNIFKPVLQATISCDIIKYIQQVLVFLNKMTMFNAKTNLVQFIENLIGQCGTQEISLLYAIENKQDIRYAQNFGNVSTLVNNRIISHVNISNSVHYFQMFLLNKYQQMSQNDEIFIELFDEDVNNIEHIWDDLPHSISIKCEVLQDKNMKYFVYIKTIGRQSLVDLLSPFRDLNEKIMEYANIPKYAPSHDDSIHVEIIHLPESMIGTITFRLIPHLNDYSYLSKYGILEEFELNLNDLYISISNNRIVLRSKKLNKEIIPRMSSIYTSITLNTMPIFHFFSDLQYQNDYSRLEIQKDAIIRYFDYFPRVVYKNCILFRARWTIKRKTIEPFFQMECDKELLFSIKKWQHERSIPDIVLMVDGDNELYIDLNNLLSIRAWLFIVKERSYFYLEEFLFNHTNTVVHGPEGYFTNEFFFNFHK